MLPEDIKKWEIYSADLGNYEENNPVKGRPKEIVGHEQGGRRPVIILGNGQIAEIVTVAPCTGVLDKKFYEGKPFIFAKKEHTGLDKDSLILVPHVRSISTERMHRKIGCLTDTDTQRKIDVVLKNIFSQEAELSSGQVDSEAQPNNEKYTNCSASPSEQNSAS